MYKKITELFRKESGNALLLVSITFVALLSVTGLVIDGSLLYLTKTELQKVANSAAISAGQELPSDSETVVMGIVDDILQFHQTEEDLANVEIELNNYVTVQLMREVELVFSSVLGFESVPVEAEATAQLGFLGRAVGAAPLGVSDEIELTYGDTYFLKVGSGDSEYGEFGILALEGPGADTYRQTFRNGFKEELKVGDIVNTESGNVAGPTYEVVREKIASCNDMNDRDCDRVILVPVYRPHYIDGKEGGKVKQVEITGFAYFYLLDPDSIGAAKDTVPGIFIKRTGSGFVEPGAADWGAYAVRLVKK